MITYVKCGDYICRYIDIRLYMLSNYIYKYYFCLYLQCVPNEFLSKHEDLHGKFVELKVGGKSWFVKLNYYLQGSRFHAGWRKFQEECKLKKGDICLFELIDEKKCVFKVSFVTKIS